MRDLQRMLVSKFENIGFVINNYSASCVYKGKSPSYLVRYLGVVLEHCPPRTRDNKLKNSEEYPSSAKTFA